MSHHHDSGSVRSYKIFMSNGFAYHDEKEFENKFTFQVFAGKGLENFVQQVNEYKPDGLYFVGWKSQFKLSNDGFFSKLTKEAKDNLKIIANHGVGYDNVDVKSALTTKDKPIIVTHTPDVVSDATADTAIILMLNASRKTRVFEENLRQLKWKSGYETLMGHDLKGKTLGIIGMGSIGTKTALRALSFGMRILYHQRNQKKDVEEKLKQVGQLVSEVGRYYHSQPIIEYCQSMDDLLKQSDIISIHTPLTESTRHLITKKQFDMMKKNCIIINTARGAVIHEQDLVQALKSNTIAGCGLDVFEFEPTITQELLELASNNPCISLLPHIGTQTDETRLDMEQLCIENLRRVLVENKDPVSPVPEHKYLFSSQ
ncbi:hypothetical protein C9374_014492 [Naegleria lovaniensis]|uniref:Glyoxylate reductase n=1 Tax=Naegleria lovaniensis TaxID=51637 RepID=A0AA88GUF4_NAELO|nr:uncharacterized protein C9374_014492 [Naegleria lovaniensis]KAG2389092.1 hypothetical protein C9374_014492 [Naegleria lovaniensis]